VNRKSAWTAWLLALCFGLVGAVAAQDDDPAAGRADVETVSREGQWESFTVTWTKTNASETAEVGQVADTLYAATEEVTINNAKQWMAKIKFSAEDLQSGATATDYGVICVIGPNPAIVYCDGVCQPSDVAGGRLPFALDTPHNIPAAHHYFQLTYKRARPCSDGRYRLRYSA